MGIKLSPGTLQALRYVTIEAAIQQPKVEVGGWVIGNFDADNWRVSNVMPVTSYKSRSWCHLDWDPRLELEALAVWKSELIGTFHSHPADPDTSLTLSAEDLADSRRQFHSFDHLDILTWAWPSVRGWRFQWRAWEVRADGSRPRRLQIQR